MSNNNVNSMSMKKVLLLFFAILSVSIAASAKQGTALTEDFSSLKDAGSLTFGTTYNWDLEWYAMRADYKTLYTMAKKNYGTTTSPNYALGCTNGSYAGSTEAIIVTSAKAGTVSVDLIVYFGASYANGRGAIYKMTYNAESGRYEKGDKICSIDTSKYNTTTWTTMSGVLDEDGYIGIEFAYEYIDNYKNIPLLPNTVSGTITAKDGVTTISGATVDLLDGNGDVAYTTTSGENGTYSFGETVADGDYTLRVSADGYLTYTATAATTISDDKTDLNASLEPIPLNKYNFSGTVSYNGVAIQGMSLNLVGGDTDVTCTTHGDGSFSFTDVLEGTYTLTVYCTPEYMPRTQTIVLDRDITDHEVTLSKYTLLGSVKYLTGEGDADYVLIEGASVVLKHGDTEIGTATTTANGEFSFSDLSGCDVNDPDDYYTLTASAAGFVTESDNISLNGGVNVDKQFVLELSVSTITGTVTRSDTDAALGSVEVKLLSGDAQVATATSEADNGRYTFTITGKFAEAGYTLQVAASEYYEEYLSEEAVTPTYGGSITQDIAISPVLQKYIVVIENENHEALLDSKVTIVKKVTKTIDSFEYLGDNSDVVKALKENGWLAVTAPNLTLARSSAYRYEGIWSIKVPNETMGYTATFVRAAKAGSVSLKAAKESSTGTIYVYKMTDNGNGTYSTDGSPIASNTNINSSTDWSEVSFTLTEDCIIGFVVKRAYIDYYVNDFGPDAQATTAPAYAAPALAAAADETPATIKIDKNLIDLKTITVTIPKVDNPGGEYTATATAPCATLKETGAEADVWDFTFGVDETHTSVFTGGTVTGVSDVSVDSSEAAEAEYYTLQGVRVTNPQAGIYICRRGSATSKVLIR